MLPRSKTFLFVAATALSVGLTLPSSVSAADPVVARSSTGSHDKVGPIRIGHIQWEGQLMLLGVIAAHNEQGGLRALCYVVIDPWTGKIVAILVLKTK